jgi:ATPase subunit of ABC transporter with duplicated ATPase domains
MLRLEAVSVSSSDAPLLESVDAILVKSERVGLVGPNGSGKSTLLRVLAQIGQDPSFAPSGPKPYFSITSGKIEGYLSHERAPGAVLLVTQDNLCWSTLFPNVGTEDELLQMTVPDVLDMAAAEGGDQEIEEAETWRRLCVAAGESLQWNIANYSETPIGKLSPGCAHRAYLAIALHRPSIELLLLDEPTNHLDLPSLIWLQRTILVSGKTVMLVSHDEAFLDAVVDHIWEIDGHTHSLTVSAAKYSAYKHAKLLAIEYQRKAYENQQERHQKMTATADRLKLATKRGEFYVRRDHATLHQDFKRERAGRSGKRASAVMKQRDKEEKIDKVVDHAPLRLRLAAIDANLDSSIIFDSVELGYGAGTDDETPLPVPPISLRIDYSERITLMGYNGIGKSTMLRTLTGEIKPLSGSVSVGRALRFGNLMQEHESLPRDKTPRDLICSLTQLEREKAASTVISYGLTIHQVDSPIAELNPGARARLLLATFSLRKVNVLILDEPTNHLDEEAVHEVIASLESYPGTIIVVSHNRDFLNSLNLTRTYRLSSDGLEELESVDSFVEETEDIVEEVVQTCFRAS